MKTAVFSQTARRHAFTLIEVMVVVAIIGLIAAMGIPGILQTFRKEGMRKAVGDVEQMLGDARARAIFSQMTTEVVFFPAEKRLEIGNAPADAAPPVPGGATANNLAAPMPTPALPAAPASLLLPDNVDIAMLDINLLDFGAAEVARVRFFPNGTCDELTLILHSGDEWKKITLEFSTALATVGPVTK